jgi:DNA repair ATPase RecN
MTQSRFDAFSLSLARARHRGAATLAVIAISLLAVGCGGGGGGGGRLSKAQYEQRIQKDGQKLTSAFKPLNKVPSSLKELADELKVGQDKLREAASDLEGATPPKNIEADNKALVKALRQLADDLDGVRSAAAKNDPSGVRTELSKLQQSHALVDARRATDDMKKKGYKLGTIGQ